MLTAQVLTDTIAKQSTVPALKLAPDFKANLPKGSYPIVKWSQAEANHFRVTFEKPIASLIGREYQTWLVWGDAIRFYGSDGKPDFSKDLEIKNIQYASQRDGNHDQWWRMCCSSSSWMLLSAIAPNALRQAPTDDAYLKMLNNMGFDSTNHEGHTKLLQKLGVESQWRYNLDFDDLDRSLQAGVPVVISLYHKGSLDAPAGGHCCVCMGKSSDDYLFFDPWGFGFSYSNINGKKVRYPAYPSLDRRWLTDGSNTGWGRWVTAVNGKPTGL